MKNLDSVFAAYAIAWGVLLFFFASLAKRTADLRTEVDRLKSLITRSK